VQLENRIKNMKQLKHILAVAGIAAALGLSAGNAAAQGRPQRGNFDPEQFRTQMMERFKERLEVKSDDEWKVISERITKVQEAQREARIGGFGGFGGRGGGRGGNRGGGDNAGGADRGNRGGGSTNPDVEALNKAIEDKASNDDLKAKMAKVRESVKAKEADLAKAQDDLKKVLSVRQEAIAITMGLLK
jgi:hypothetical protein